MNQDDERDFSSEDIVKIKELLEESESGHILSLTDPSQLEVFRRVMRTFTDHEDEIKLIIRREQVSKMRTELRLKYWGIIKWVLATFILIVGVVQGWQAVIAPLFKGLSR